MTEPTPPPIPLGYPENVTTWCVSCEIHLAMTTKPLCPSCLDDQTRGQR